LFFFVQIDSSESEKIDSSHEEVDKHTKELVDIEFVNDEIVKTEIIDGTGETDVLADLKTSFEIEIVPVVENVQKTVEVNSLKPVDEDEETDDWMSPQTGVVVTTKKVEETKPNEYNCCMCKRIFSTETAVLAHARDEHTLQEREPNQKAIFAGVVECNLCNSQFRSVGDMIQHKKKFSEMGHHMKPHNEPISNAFISSVNGLRGHTSKVHSSRKRMCKVLRHTNRKKNIACRFCPKKFDDKNLLRIHMKVGILTCFFR
jgi:hypothetical protein